MRNRYKLIYFFIIPFNNIWKFIAIIFKQVSKILFTLTNNTILSVGGMARPAQIRMAAGPGEFDVTKISFSFDGREQNLEKPFIYDLPEIKSRETIVIEA
jgi:hypothetical protein